MNGDELKTMEEQLAIALAQGVPIKAWARAQNAQKGSDYRWASDPKVRNTLFTVYSPR
jgi:hypothetical protein